MTKYDFLERGLRSTLRHPYRTIGIVLLCMGGLVTYSQIAVNQLKQDFCQNQVKGQSCLDGCIRDKFYDLAHNYTLDNGLALRIAEDTCKNENR